MSRSLVRAMTMTISHYYCYYFPSYCSTQVPATAAIRQLRQTAVPGEKKCLRGVGFRCSNPNAQTAAIPPNHDPQEPYTEPPSD